MKAGYKKVGIYFNSQAAVRADKRMWEGKGARWCSHSRKTRSSL